MKNNVVLIFGQGAKSKLECVVKCVIFRTIFNQFLRGISLLFLLFLGLNTNAQTRKKFEEKYPNGKFKVKGAYQDEKKAGNWIYYAETGSITRKEKWKNGNFVWSIDYNEKHKKVKGMNAKGEEIIYKGCNCKN
jgi:hypothetical protein